MPSTDPLDTSNAQTLYSADIYRRYNKDFPIGTPFDSVLEAATHTALGAWSEVATITFTETDQTNFDFDRPARRLAAKASRETSGQDGRQTGRCT
ncbi:MAG: hypothetical protein HXY25_03055 [Alphaproteobacteria bacterium]|nr:hypothetical protein [Alphaproteobacteria bacterium]